MSPATFPIVIEESVAVRIVLERVQAIIDVALTFIPPEHHEAFLEALKDDARS